MPPTNTISGSLGKAGAGAVVIVIGNAVSGDNAGFNEQICPPVTADGNGNYITPGLAPNDTVIPHYVVVPILFGAEFSPFSQQVTITNADITGINWNGPASYYSLVQDFSDTCNRGGVTQNPAVGWTTTSGHSNVDLQIVADAIQGSASDGAISGGFPTGYTPAADCYFGVTLVSMSTNDALELILRDTTAGATAGFEVEFVADTGSANAFFQMNDVAAETALISAYGFLLDEPLGQYTFNVGDQLLVLCRGQNCYCFQRPVNTNAYYPLMAGRGLSVTPNAGISDIIMLVTSGATSAQSFKNVVGGKIVAGSAPTTVWSPVDARTTKPNSATYRTVNAAQIDDVQTSSNIAVPSTDSRKAGAPVASATGPQNSRTAPPFKQ
jgi:hypothetical protein